MISVKFSKKKYLTHSREEKFECCSKVQRKNIPTKLSTVAAEEKVERCSKGKMVPLSYRTKAIPAASLILDEKLLE